MDIIPVIDLQGGAVVHGVAGQRDQYRPIKSQLCPSSEAVEVAAAFRDRLGLSRLYVADLDALEGREPPALDLYEKLVEAGSRLLVDAGVREPTTAQRVLECGVADVVVALESLRKDDDLLRIIDVIGAESLVFSVDLRDGQPVGGPPAWHGSDAGEIVNAVLEAGVRRLILLDVASVGTGTGCPLVDFVRALDAREPRPEMVTGGGVRSAVDLQALRDAGADGVLVATALHSGAISTADLARL